MLRFFGQPKYADKELFGYELFLREKVAGNWQFPKSFSQIHGHEFSQLLAATLALMSTDIQLVSINLDREQFIEEAYICELGRVQEEHPQIQVVVELTEHDGKVTNRQLIYAATCYVQSGIWICLDDVGTGDNQISFVQQIDPYVSEYKFALQNFHGKKDYATSVSPYLQFWREQAALHHKFFAIEGFENAVDLKIAQNYHADIKQGYYFGRPHEIAAQSTLLVADH